MSTKSSNIYKSRLRQLHKARQVKKAGYANGIQSLPSEIKNSIDELLTNHQSPTSIIKQLSSVYPKSRLPSRTALYNYRNKYFTPSEVSKKDITLHQQNLDIEKINIKETIAEQIKQFLVIDVPYFREQMYQESKSLKQSYKTKAYFDSIKLMTELLPKLNIAITIHTEQPTPEGTTTGEDRIRRILARYGKQLESILPNSQNP